MKSLYGSYETPSPGLFVANDVSLLMTCMCVYEGLYIYMCVCVYWVGLGFRGA